MARKIAELARQAIQIQNASNLSGIVQGWVAAIVELRNLLPELSTDEFNKHPINQLWADKCKDLAVIHTVVHFGDAYKEVLKLSENLVEEKD